MAFLKYIQMFDNSLTGRAYVHKRSADTNLAEIHEEISELLDKQMNVQKDT